jgi:PiT family inorganic phosphate transporter
MPEFNVYVILTLIAGLYMAWTIGANDVANAMGTSVGSKALTLTGAIIVAAVFEFSGAFFAGGHVASTIKGEVVDLSAFAGDPHALALGMLSALVGAGMWLHLATWRGWPDSTTHAIVGAVTGIGLMLGGTHVVKWPVLVTIVASWIASPILGGIVAWTVFSIIRHVVFKAEHPALRARTVTPIVVGLVAFVLVLSMVYKGLKNLNLDLPLWQALLAAAGVSSVAWAAAFFTGRNRSVPLESNEAEIASVEKQFAYLQIVTACYVAFAHGSNDAANAVGPMAAAMSAAGSAAVGSQVEVPPYLLALGGFGIVLGLATWGYRVIYTIGNKITELTPSRGFAMEFSTATTVLLGSKLGLPVSTTHILIGSVVGVGIARGIGALNVRMVRIIFLSWIGTVPASAVFSASVYYLLSWMIL